MRRISALLITMALACNVASAVTPPEGGAGAGEIQFMHFEPGLMIWTLVIFVALLALLSRFAFRPIAQALVEREQRIRDSVETARKTREEAEEILAKYRAQLDEARAEARKILEEGRNQAEETRREITDKARQESQRILEAAQAEIEHLQAKSLEELRETVAHLSVRIASELVRARVDDKENRRLVDEFLDDLKTHDTATG